MKRVKKETHEILDQALRRYGNLSRHDVDSALDRAWANLQSAPEFGLEWKVAPSQPARKFVIGIVTAAAVVLVAFVSFVIVTSNTAVVANRPKAEMYRVWESAEERLAEGSRIGIGDRVRVRGKGGAIALLADGSHIEMRSKTELSVERADDGIRIDLKNGGLIVHAAKQRAGHFYVQTKDVTVSVIGTVFLVSSEEEGSRVAVLEGEVRVQQGNTTKKLLSGEQLSTNPLLERVPVKEEISWSESAPVHVARLQQTTATTAPAHPAFAVGSIKPIPAGELIPGTGLGVACRGTDGILRVLLTFTQAGQESVTAPQGRCVGNGVFLTTLIEFAYGIQARHVSGGPEWARASAFITWDETARGKTVLGVPAYVGSDGFKWLEAVSFQIEAAADDPSTATREQLRQMLQTMLADRFKLKFHRGSTLVPGYALVVANKGWKLKPIPDDYEESQVPQIGKSTTAKLALTLSGLIDAPVVDKTGLTGAYEYELHLFSPSAGGTGGSTGGGPLTPADRVGLFSSRLEDQLGLRLVPEKAVPAETLVIDSVELPTPN